MTTHHTEADAPDMSLAEMLRRIYAFFYNKRVGLLIILAMVLVALLGVLFVQAPDAVRADPEAWSQWLDELRPKYGGWTDILAALGMFNIFSGWPFRIVTVLLALSIIACTTHRFPLLWKQAMRPHTHVKDAFFQVAKLHGTRETTAAPAEALSAAGDALRRKGFRVIPSAGAEDSGFYADRFRFAPFGTVVAHTAFVIILAGVLVTSLFGFRNDNFSAPVGQRVAVTGAPGYEIEALSFNDTYDATGNPTDYVSELVLYKDGAKVKQQEVRVNTPLNHGGYKFSQASFGVAAEVKVERTATKEVVNTAAIPLQWESDDQALIYGRLPLEADGLLVVVLTPASGVTSRSIGPGQVRVDVYDSKTRETIGSKVLSPGQPVQIGDMTYTFARERQYTGLMVIRDPGAPIVWTGAALLMLGTCLTMFLRHHRIWAKVARDDEGRTQLTFASPDRHDSMFERRFFEYLDSAAGRSHTTPEEK